MVLRRRVTDKPGPNGQALKRNHLKLPFSEVLTEGGGRIGLRGVKKCAKLNEIDAILTVAVVVVAWKLADATTG